MTSPGECLTWVHEPKRHLAGLHPTPIEALPTFLYHCHATKVGFQCVTEPEKEAHWDLECVLSTEATWLGSFPWVSLGSMVNADFPDNGCYHWIWLKRYFVFLECKRNFLSSASWQLEKLKKLTTQEPWDHLILSPFSNLNIQWKVPWSQWW